MIVSLIVRLAETNGAETIELKRRDEGDDDIEGGAGDTGGEAADAGDACATTTKGSSLTASLAAFSLSSFSSVSSSTFLTIAERTARHASRVSDSFCLTFFGGRAKGGERGEGLWCMMVGG